MEDPGTPTVGEEGVMSGSEHGQNVDREDSTSTIEEEEPSASSPIADAETVESLRLRVKQLEEALTVAEANFEHRVHWADTKNRQFVSELAAVRQELVTEKQITEEKGTCLFDHIEVSPAYEESPMTERVVVQLQMELTTRDEQLRTTQDLNLSVRVETLEAEKRDLVIIVSKRQQEIDRLSEQSEGLQEQTQALRLELRGANNRITELESETMKDKLLLSGKDQEITQARKTSEWLNAELKQKSEEFLSYRQEKTAQLSEAQSQLDNAIEEKSSLESKNRVLQQRAEGLEQKVQELLQKLNESETRLVMNEQQFKKEMDAQKRLNELYENNIKEGQSHMQEMQKTLTEAQEDWETTKDELEEKIRQLEGESSHWREQFDRLYEETDRLRHQAKEADDARTSTDEVGFRSGLYIAVALKLRDSISASKLWKVLARLKANATRHDLHNAGMAIYKNSVNVITVLTLVAWGLKYASYEEEKQQRLEIERELEITRERFAEAYERLEHLSPYVQDLEKESRQLQVRYDKLFTDLSRALEDKKTAVTRCVQAEAERAKQAEEVKMMEQDVRDLARQVRIFCIQLQQTKSGTWEDTERYLQELTARFGAGEEVDEAPTDALISQRLVEVTSLEGLVQQNVDLRRLARSLARQFEECQQKLEQQRSDFVTTEIEQARTRIQELDENAEKMARQLRYVVKQRNDLRAVLEGKANGIQMSPAKSSASRPETPLGNPRSDGLLSESEYERLYRELQRDHDNLIKESGTSTKELSNQVDKLRQERSDLAIQVAKLNHQINFQNERYQLLATNADMQSLEISQLRERLANMANAATQQDAKTQELTNGLMSERLRAEQLSSQIQQLKIEREVWEASKDRAVRESQDLLTERNLANERSRAMQRQLEDREDNWRTERKRLEDKLDAAERELALVRKQLQDALEENRAILARKDTEVRGTQAKVERLTAECEKVKGELMLSRNKEENLAQRLAEITDRLTLAEAKIVSYEGREGGESTPETAEKRARDLEKELADARRQIMRLQEDVQLSKEREANLKELANASEQQLLEFNETYDTYKAAKEKEIGELEERLRDVDNARNEILEQMKNTDRELIESREKTESQRHEFEQRIRALEAQIETIKKTEEAAVKSQEEMQEDVKRHARIAQQAKESYEREVVAHSSALQAVQHLKAQYEKVKADLGEAQQRSTLAESELQTASKSWNETKKKLEEQIEEARRRMEDLQAQNELLHSQFERMQEGQKVSDSVMEGVQGQTDDAERVIRELRELVKYARNERDILRTKLDIATSENNRFKMELQHLQSTLDETRARLDEERRRSQDALQDDRRHKELMDKIEQANLLRESNVTLRDQVEQSAKKVKDLEEKLRESVKELEPLREQVVTLQAEVEVRKDENASLTDDNKRWKDRVDQILRKYQRIDPHDYDTLKQDVERLTKEKDELTETKNQCETQKEQFAAKVKELEDKNKRFLEIARKQKEAIDVRSKQLLEMTTRLNEWSGKEAQMAEKDKEIASLKEQLADPEKNEQFVAMKAEMEKRRSDIIQQANSTLAKFKERNYSLKEELRNVRQENATLQQQLTVLQQEVAQLKERSLTKTDAVPERVQQLEQQLAQIQSESDRRVAAALDEWKSKNTGEMEALKLRKQLLESQLASEKRRVGTLNEKIKGLEEGLANATAGTASPHVLAGSQIGGKRQREEVEEEENAVETRTQREELVVAPALIEAGTPLVKEPIGSGGDDIPAAKKARVEVLETQSIVATVIPEMTSEPVEMETAAVMTGEALQQQMIVTTEEVLDTTMSPDNSVQDLTSVSRPNVDITPPVTVSVIKEIVPPEAAEAISHFPGTSPPAQTSIVEETVTEQTEAEIAIETKLHVAVDEAEEILEDVTTEEAGNLIVGDEEGEIQEGVNVEETEGEDVLHDEEEITGVTEGEVIETDGPQVEDITDEIAAAGTEEIEQETGIIEEEPEVVPSVTVPSVTTGEREEPNNGDVTITAETQSPSISDSGLVESAGTVTPVELSATVETVPVPTTSIPATELNVAAPEFIPTTPPPAAGTTTATITTTTSTSIPNPEDPAYRMALLKRKLQAAQMEVAAAAIATSTSAVASRSGSVQPSEGGPRKLLRTTPGGGPVTETPVSTPGSNGQVVNAGTETPATPTRGRGRGVRRAARFRGGSPATGARGRGVRGRGAKAKEQK
ncbi:hypothetical protein SpCBS45565_g02578 [Spizellomyces sp. 'palustris']|nr:hypothetical protein SpCBS45565_g02578 [Spizellomyces sp. 'palustris']